MAAVRRCGCAVGRQPGCDVEASGSFSKEAFFESKVPAGEAVFKDPLTAPASLDVTTAANDAPEQISAKAGITGAAFVEPGRGPKQPRPAAAAAAAAAAAPTSDGGFW